MLGRWRKGGRNSQGSGGAKLPHPPVKTVPSPWESCSRTAQRVLRGSPYGTLRGGQGWGSGAGVGTGSDGEAGVLPFRLSEPSQGDPGVCGGEVEVFVEPIGSRPTLVVFGAGHVGKSVIHLARWLGFRT